MKTNNIYKVALGTFIGLAFAACTVDEYTPAPMEDSSKTYVSIDLTTPRNLDIDGSDILVPLTRTNAEGELTVTVALTDTSKLFTLADSKVKFASGDSVAYAAVSYSYDDIDPSATYGITVTITEGLTSEYAPAALPITCKKAWQNLGTAQWYDDWWIGGPYEKQLIKAPDGTETYRLLDPWDKASVTDAGLVFTENTPYLEFVINEDGSISWGQVMNLGFTFSGMTCHHLHPSAQGNAADAAKNAMVMENVARFCWYPILNFNGSSFSWWGRTAVAFISFPGGPDLSELLGLE